VEPGDSVLVLGFGPIGAAVTMAARAAGAAAVYVSEPTQQRRHLAMELGATDAFDPNAVDARREVYLRTRRIGPDIVFECTGAPVLLSYGIDAARRGGRVVLVGIGHGTAEVTPQRVVPYEREVIGSLGYRHDLPRVVSLIERGLVVPDAMITGVVPLEDAVEGAFDTLLADRGEHMKILIDVGAD
jgi:(R,R)-butanediol dehydrogenase/meso-butanediol dehydrogenase/diacetyl reductase